jgi:GPH family glycoside/pentoside/hexuronide:cation symporter
MSKPVSNSGSISKPFIYAYALGFFPQMLAGAVILGHAQFALSESFNLSIGAIGRAWFLLQLITAVLAPIGGVFGDRVGAFNCLVASFVPWSFSFYFLFGLSTTESSETLILCSLVAHGALNTFIVVNFLSLFGELTPAERSAVAVPKQIFSIVGLLVGMACPPLITDGWKQPRRLAIIVSSTMLILMTISLAAMKFYKSSSTDSSSSSGGGASTTTKSKSLSTKQQPLYRRLIELATTNNAAFSIFMLATASMNCANSLLGATFQSFAKYAMQISEPVTEFGSLVLSASAQTSILLLSFYVLALLGLPLWSALATRVGNVRAWSIECAVFAALLLIYVAPLHGFRFALFGTSLLGTAMGGFTMLPDLIIAEMCDAHSQGLCFGIRAVVIKAMAAVQGIISARVLHDAAFVGDSRHLPTAVAALRWLTVALPSLLLFVAAFISWFGIVTKKTSNNNNNNKKID